MKEKFIEVKELVKREAPRVGYYMCGFLVATLYWTKIKK